MNPVASLQAPPQACLDRAALLGQVVAVEGEADLQAQGVARGQARRSGAAVEDLVPQRHRVVGVGQQLHAVLARVARAAHQHGTPAEHAVRCVHPSREGRVGHGLHDLAGAGALDREHRVAVVGVLDLGAVCLLGVAAKPREVLVVVCRVGDRQVVVG